MAELGIVLSDIMGLGQLNLRAKLRSGIELRNEAWKTEVK
jgi:hypothetical protein